MLTSAPFFLFFFSSSSFLPEAAAVNTSAPSLVLHHPLLPLVSFLAALCGVACSCCYLSLFLVSACLFNAVQLVLFFSDPPPELLKPGCWKRKTKMKSRLSPEKLFHETPHDTIKLQWAGNALPSLLASPPYVRARASARLRRARVTCMLSSGAQRRLHCTTFASRILVFSAPILRCDVSLSVSR